MGSGISKLSRKKKKSKKAAKKSPAGMVISGPQDVTIQIPRNLLNKFGKPVQQVSRDMDRKCNTLLAALQHMSEYIGRRQQHATVVAVGGAVNILHLRSRANTHDVDVFGSDFDNHARILLDEAMHSAQQDTGLSGPWYRLAQHRDADVDAWADAPAFDSGIQKAECRHLRQSWFDDLCSSLGIRILRQNQSPLEG